MGYTGNSSPVSQNTAEHPGDKTRQKSVSQAPGTQGWNPTAILERLAGGGAGEASKSPPRVPTMVYTPWSPLDHGGTNDCSGQERGYFPGVHKGPRADGPSRLKDC